MDTTRIVPFRMDTPEADLVDLTARLQQTAHPMRPPSTW